MTRIYPPDIYPHGNLKNYSSGSLVPLRDIFAYRTIQISSGKIFASDIVTHAVTEWKSIFPQTLSGRQNAPGQFPD
jgi:hypothetical protein